MNDQRSNIRSVYTYVSTWTVYFDWICNPSNNFINLEIWGTYIRSRLQKNLTVVSRLHRDKFPYTDVLRFLYTHYASFENSHYFNSFYSICATFKLVAPSKIILIRNSICFCNYICSYSRCNGGYGLSSECNCAFDRARRVSWNV